MEETLCGGKDMEETCGGKYGGKSRDKCRENNSLGVKLSYKTTILTIKEERQDSQNWKEDGGKMEETLTRRRKVEVKNGARYGGKSEGVWRKKKIYIRKYERKIIEN